MRDVAITGIGVISCIGQSADEYFTRLDAGEHGVTAAPWAEPEAGQSPGSPRSRTSTRPRGWTSG